MGKHSKIELEATSDLWAVLTGNKDIADATALQAVEKAKLPQADSKVKKKKPVYNESIAQQRIFRWAKQQWQWADELKMMYHIPNEMAGLGGKTQGQIYGIIDKKCREGLKTGMPDIHLPVARCGYHGLWIELKVGYNKPTPQQLECIENLKKLGHYACWCVGEKAAIDIISRYLLGELGGD